MIFTKSQKTIRVMLTTFRDGLQSALGGKVRLNDILPAMEAATSAGIRHFEFGGGARFQAPYFYVGENPFECMSRMREVAGPEADLQILTRSVSGVTLTTQRPETLALRANLMKKHGTTWDRNFDYMNDVDNLAQTGQPIVDAGMHHQVCIALMGLPFHSNKVHTPDFYIDVIRRLLKKEVHFDSVCLKDASGTADPRTCYETARGLKKILPPEVPLWQHTHDTASLAIPDYMAGIEGGVDGIDLSVRPLASGTVQPDVRSMAHALKGTGYRLDIDPNKMPEIEHLLSEGLENYQFSPVTIVPDARVVAFPMPGGAIGPNIHMMTEAGIEDKYGDVLAEFPVVVKAAGAWTSVTPGSQQYWLQAFNNVLYGRWNKISASHASQATEMAHPPLLQLVYDFGIRTELLPPIIFLGVGSLTDFRPLLRNPVSFLLGAAAQIGIFVAALGAYYGFGFTIKEAASIGIIGGADGPTSIFLTAILAPELLGAVAVAAYSYMALVPIIQPPILNLLTTHKERSIPITELGNPSQTAVILFPIVTAMLASLLVPSCAPLLGMLMFGNLLTESGVTDRLSQTAGTALINVVTLFLGLVIGATMVGEAFLSLNTLFILILGAIAFIIGTTGGILLAKGLNFCLPVDRRLNPCIGAAGVSAVPMTARVVQNYVSRHSNGAVNPLMAAMGPNVAGVIGSAVAAGVFLALLQ